jgi:cardiolipin synthase (CMP-forming)
MLTGLRLIAAPATAGLLMSEHFNAAFGVFALAGISDAADGWLAKRFGLSSALGRVLDPAADKALMLAVFVTLAMLGDVPLWLAAVVVGRDAAIVLGLLIAVAMGKSVAIEPLAIGKLTTLLQVAYVALHLASLAFDFSLEGIVPLDACAVAAVTLASWLAYGLVLAEAMGRAPAR